MIELVDVTKSYRSGVGKRRYVFRDLNLKIGLGKNVALMGRNGAGKSTLMQLISGAQSPDSGCILRNCNVSWPVGVQVGFQESLSGRENAQFICRIHGDSHHDMKRRLVFAEQFSGLGDFFNRPVRSYSSGMRSRLALSMSMAFSFDVYLVDEQAFLGDYTFRQKAASVLLSGERRPTIIMVSHDAELIHQWCDIAIYLEDGQYTVYENINEAIERYKRSQ